jgi:transposase
MRFVAVKGIEQQAAGMAFRTRDLFIRQKTQTINALRGALSEETGLRRGGRLLSL